VKALLDAREATVCRGTGAPLWAVADYAARTEPASPVRLAAARFHDLPDVAFVRDVPEQAMVRISREATGFDCATSVLGSGPDRTSLVVNRTARSFFECSAETLEMLRCGVDAGTFSRALAAAGVYPARPGLLVGLARHGLIEVEAEVTGPVGDALMMEPTTEPTCLDGVDHVVNLLSGRTIGMAPRLAELIGALHDTGEPIPDRYHETAGVRALLRAGVLRRLTR
jgi:hypothetical protein